jgi:hypothetical protein
MNNMDTAAGLAATVLGDTDWEVDSEALVERVEEGLVYLKTTKILTATRVLDNYPETTEDGKTVNFSTRGIKEQKNMSIPKDAEILGFYSSCTNKPHRF